MDRRKYLDKDFNYKLLTKVELRNIMSQFNVENIPPITALKSVILGAYKKNIYDKIDNLIKKEGKLQNFSQENVFQGSQEKNLLQNEISFQRKTIKEPSIVGIKNKEINRKNIAVEKKPKKQEEINKKEKVQKEERKEKVQKEESVENKQSFSASAISDKLKTVRRKVQIDKFLNFLKNLFLLSFVSAGVYLKFGIPYCEKGLQWCIPLPKNSHLVDSKMFCNKGFRKITSFIDYCVFDTRIEYNNRVKAKSIIKALENLRREYSYGMRNTPKIVMKELEIDADVLDILKKSDMLIFSGNTVEALNTRISYKLLFNYYVIKGIKGILTVICTVFIVRVMYLRRRTIAKHREAAQVVTKNVLSSLNKQLLIAIKTESVSDTVFSSQLQQVYDVNDGIWYYVEKMLADNSNVEAIVDSNGEMKFRWIGPLFYKNKFGSTENLSN
ncbi:hypothetical protein NUSPORA_01476 [Nucleospora cyclopteri]